MSSGLDMGRASAGPHPLPALVEQGLHELMGALGREGPAGQWPKKGGGQQLG